MRLRLLLILILATGALIHIGKAKADHSLPQYAQQMEQQYGISKGLLTSICATESNWKNVKGAAGEIGVCQLLPSSMKVAFGPVAQPYRPLLFLWKKGEYVKVVQKLVGTAQDGVYGTITSKAVVDYQIAHNLRIDGIVGPQTWASLIGTASYTELLWDQYKNIEYAARYIVWLKEQLQTNNDFIIAAAYNGGTANPIVKYMLKVENYYDMPEM